MVSTWGCNRRSFSAVGGLDWHLQRLHQMVMMPALCRDVYDRFHMKPPRGILFHGPPGTGKTLVAGALARECSQASRKVEFLYRKSADILNMWLGESEKGLTQLFEEARSKRPAIIFFDEIDGLAPARCTRSDHVHTSIVSTLLALMDGLEDASEVVVIGATNRIDAVDPALRRPGRFDAELFFPLPGSQARLEILRRLVSPWRAGDRPKEAMLRRLALSTAGYCGADLQALCRDAVTCALCRQFPDLACRRRAARPSQSSLRRLQVESCDFLEAKSRIVPATHRFRCCMVRELSLAVQPLFGGMLDLVVRMLQQYCPFQFLHPGDRHAVLHTPTQSCRLMVSGTMQQGHTRHLGPAVLDHLKHLPVHSLDVVSLFDVSTLHPEDVCIQTMKEARSNAPSILYLPDVSGWWELVSEQTRAVFLALVRDLDPSEPVLVLATADCPYADLQDNLREMFREELGRLVHMRNANTLEREAYYTPLCIEATSPPQNFSHSSTLLESCSGPDGYFHRDSDCGNASNPKTLCSLPNGKKRCATEDNHRRSTKKRCGPKLGPQTKRSRPMPTDVQDNAKFSGEGCGSLRSPETNTDILDEYIHEPDNSGEVDIDHNALDLFFEHVVSSTDNCPFQTLEALYGGLNIIIRRNCIQLQRQRMLLDMQIFMKHFEETMKK